MSIYYHYTTLRAFLSMVENNELWFSRIDCLNDINEYKYYNVIYNKVINDIRVECYEGYIKDINKAE